MAELNIQMSGSLNPERSPQAPEHVTEGSEALKRKWRTVPHVVSDRGVGGSELFLPGSPCTDRSASLPSQLSRVSESCRPLLGRGASFSGGVCSSLGSQCQTSCTSLCLSFLSHGKDRSGPGTTSQASVRTARWRRLKNPCYQGSRC